MTSVSATISSSRKFSYILASLVFALIAYTPVVYAAGLVPCTGKDPCKLNQILVVIERIIDFLIKGVIIPLAGLSILIAGLYYLSGAITPANKEKAKSILWTVLGGLVLALAASLIVGAILDALGANL